jgi:hypothetical protein
MDLGIGVLIAFASAMVASIVALIYLVESIRTHVGLFFSYFGLLMMLTMLLGASIYLAQPSSLTLAVAVGLNMGTMTALLGYFLYSAHSIVRSLNMSKSDYYLVSLLLVSNEVLMGSTFGIAQFGVGPFSTPYGAFYTSVNSYWFFYPMMSEMLSLYIMLYLKGRNQDELYPLVGITAFPITALHVSHWSELSMALTLVIAVYGALKSSRTWRWIYTSLAISALAVRVSPLPYDAAILLSMIYYYVYSLPIGRREFVERK